MAFFSMSARVDAAPAFSRAAMLSDLAEHVVRAGWKDAAAKSRSLTNALEALAAVPKPERLAAAQKTWIEASLACDHMRCFQWGPIADKEFTTDFYYWKVLPYRIQQLIDSGGEPLDAKKMPELGAQVKGMFALEVLLFPASSANTGSIGPPLLDRLLTKNSARVKSYLLTLGNELASEATAIESAWSGSGPNDASAKFVSGGQQSVNAVVNQLIREIEDVSQNQLHLVTVLPMPITPQLYRVERSRSGTSLQGVMASLEGAQHFFEGRGGLGLNDAIRQVNPALETRVTQAFNSAIGSVRSINAPLENAVEKNKPAVEQALEKVRALEILIKVDVVSALGVTLTFSSNDGD